MKNLFVQKSMGHCTVLAFANMFRKDLSQFMTPEFKGCNDKEERLILAAIENNLGISEVISIRHNYNIPLPQDLVFKVLMHQDEPIEGSDYDHFDLIPYLLAVRRLPTHQWWHSVVVFNKGGQLYYIDPYNEDILKVDEKTLFDQFLDCWSVKRLTIESEDKFARLSSKAIGLELV